MTTEPGPGTPEAGAAAARRAARVAGPAAAGHAHQSQAAGRRCRAGPVLPGRPRHGRAQPAELARRHAVDRALQCRQQAEVRRVWRACRRPTRASARTAPHRTVQRRRSRPSCSVPDADSEREQAERVRLARLAVQARELAPFFRLSAETTGAGAAARSDDAPGAVTAVVASAMLARSARPLSIACARNSTARRRQRTRPIRHASWLFCKAGPEKEIYNPHAQQRPVSPYQLLAGTIIPASLVTGLNADLPGFVIAQVTEHVYDTVSGRHLLVPQGSRLIGKYDSVVAYGQERALVVWQRIIRPDGSSIVIDNLPATDTRRLCRPRPTRSICTPGSC